MMLHRRFEVLNCKFSFHDIGQQSFGYLASEPPTASPWWNRFMPCLHFGPMMSSICCTRSCTTPANSKVGCLPFLPRWPSCPISFFYFFIALSSLLHFSLPHSPLLCRFLWLSFCFWRRSRDAVDSRQWKLDKFIRRKISAWVNQNKHSVWIQLAHQCITTTSTSIASTTCVPPKHWLARHPLAIISIETGTWAMVEGCLQSQLATCKNPWSCSTWQLTIRIQKGKSQSESLRWRSCWNCI